MMWEFEYEGNPYAAVMDGGKPLEIIDANDNDVHDPAVWVYCSQEYAACQLDAAIMRSEQ